MLYIVATPIGNLEDITLRALSVLSSVDIIVCEDTRVTKRLLSKYGIKTPTISLHARSSSKKTDTIVSMLGEGKRIAYVCDAGTPGISDPGMSLVTALRQSLPKADVVAVPGANALVAALSVSGLPSTNFVFLGFLPHKKGRETLIKEIAESKRTVVIYESPHRLMKTLERFSLMLSQSRHVVVARELTKIFEQIVSGTPTEVLQYFKNNPEKIRGEFVVLVGP